MTDSFSKLEEEFSDVCVPQGDSQHTIELGSYHIGWLPIVRTVLENARKNKIKIHLIKEKFGNIRIHPHFHNEKFSEICNSACDLSLNTCSKCGKSGQLRINSGWYVTGCEDCFPGWQIEEVTN